MVRLSVVVPVYNDPEGICETLESLLELDYPDEDHEILVVDNNSTDRTRDVATNIAATASTVHVLFEDERQSSYAARNRGIRRADGDIIAFLDADMTVERSWLSDLDTLFRQRDVDYVGCAVEMFVPGERRTLVGEYNVTVGFATGVTIETQQYAPTCCLAVRREVFEDVGLFDAQLVSSGDWEFGRRVAAAGHEQYYADEIDVKHPARTTIQEMVRKSKRIGTGQEQIHQRYPETGWTRPWYHPFAVLPPRPSTFYLKTNGANTISRLLGFYLLTYALKILRWAFRVNYRFSRSHGSATAESAPS